jgi:hypothetical protein
MARLYTNLPVIEMSFQDVNWDSAFHGIWACASLLHVPRVELPEVLARFAQALRASGVFYASFKYGSEERAVDGRRFTDMTEAALGSLFRATGFDEYWTTNDVRPERAKERWLNALAIRKRE